MGATGRLLTAAVLLLCMPLVGAGAMAQSGGWRADERVLVTDFSVITSLARSSSQLFAATTGGLVVYDDAFGGFDLPITSEDGYPLTLVSAITFDHRDGSVWMASAGELIQLDPFSRRFRGRVRIGQPVDELIPNGNATSELFARVGREWWSIDTFTRDVRRADPAAVRAAIEGRSDLRRRAEILQDGFFRDALDRVAREWDGRPLTVTDVMPGRHSYAWWIGTAGGFLIDYDDGSRQGSRRAYGPSGVGMASVAVAGDGVWFAPRSPLNGRYGLALASEDLQEWLVWRADSSTAVPDGVRALLTGPHGTWAGGESGLFWLGTGEDRWTEQRAIDLAIRPVLSLTEATGPAGWGIWTGTSRGLVRIPFPGGSPDIALLPAEAITSVVEGVADVWIGTGRGLFRYDLSDPDAPQRATRVQGSSALRLPVGALAASADTVYAGLEREVWWRPGAGAEWRRLDVVGPQRGPVTALAVEYGTLWIGSTAELTAWRVGEAGVRRFAFGPDLPPDARGTSGVWAIAPVSRSEVWLALPAGALRFETGF